MLGFLFSAFRQDGEECGRSAPVPPGRVTNCCSIFLYRRESLCTGAKAAAPAPSTLLMHSCNSPIGAAQDGNPFPKGELCRTGNRKVRHFRRPKRASSR